MSTVTRRYQFEPTDVELDLPTYRPISGLAVLAMILALAGLSAFFSGMFIFVPVMAFVVGLIALNRIDRAPGRVAGRRAALGAMFLSLFCFASLASQSIYHRMAMTDEAFEFTDNWFEFLKRGEVHYAHQLMMEPASRQPLNDDLWEFYRKNPLSASMPEGDMRNAPGSGTEVMALMQNPAVNLANSPIVSTIRALGDDALIRRYRVESVTKRARGEYVTLIYAVTLNDEHKERVSFLVRVVVHREFNYQNGANSYGWWIRKYELVDPAKLKS